MTTYDEPIGNPSRGKYIVGGVLILAAVVYLIISSTAAGAQFFFTVDELLAEGKVVVGKPARVSGAVIGDTIQYDPNALELRFTVAHLPADNELLEEEGGLPLALNQAVNDPNRQRMDVVYYGVMPDLLQNEAQAIMSGRLGEDGVFHADELLLKCPTRYDGVVPEQVES
ncbi:MAG: cytochrome c maturation protein CcmE [Anaerolineales bacterium]|jgi:cytochrome c-type biogenesis protein CcmE